MQSPARGPRLLFAIAAGAVVVVAVAPSFIVRSAAPSARAQFDPTTTEAVPTTSPPTTARPTTTVAPTTAPPPSSTTAVTRPPTTGTTVPRTTSSTTPPTIPAGPIGSPVTQPATAPPEPGTGSIAWWIVLLSPLGLGMTAAVLGYNWVRTRSGA